MNAKPSTYVTPEPGSATATVPNAEPPAGASLAPEAVLHQLAFQAEAMSIVRRAGDNRDRQ